MATYFVGKGGNDGNDGLSWANRFLTLNGAEDEPVAANDTVHVGPGVYREELVVDVSGSSGNPITYIGDHTGINTDGVGGVVRISGSDDDQTVTRQFNVNATAAQRTYRTFRGFQFDLCGTGAQADEFAIRADDGPTNWIIEDCVFTLANWRAVRFDGDLQANCIIRRCIFAFNRSIGIYLTGTSGADTGHLFENCVFFAQNPSIYSSDGIGGVDIKNCSFLSSRGEHIIVVDTVGANTINVTNCILASSDVSALDANTNGDIIEDYNTFYNNTTNRTNVSVGSNSKTYPHLFMPFLLLDQLKLNRFMFSPSYESAIARIAGTSESADDLFGRDRPTTSSKKSWGAIQVDDIIREITTVRTGVASIKLPDAGRYQLKVPCLPISTTVSVYVQREANYAGTLPQMVIRQPGESARTTVDTGSVSVWNQLTDTFTPADTTDYFIIELVSNNTATSGNYDVFFDDLLVN